jgi:6-phosphogluconate dehydrogenase
MGINMCLSMGEHGIKVITFNRGKEGRLAAKKAGLLVRDSIEAMVSELRSPRTIWLMVSSSGVDEVLKQLLPLLSKGDTIIDGGNSFYEDTIRRAKLVQKYSVNFLDAGTSGGPGGARKGACVMVGGKKAVYDKNEYIFRAISAPGAYLRVGEIGSGHFVKMVHNGIEYGMMQAIAEGFEVLKKSKYKIPLTKVASLYNKRSVIESRLVGWLVLAFEKYGEDLKNISGSVAHTGEGEWTVKTAKKLKVPVKIIEDSFIFRVKSAKNPSYSGKVLSALRNQFGGHSINGSKH